jgi:FlaG/FlaF family flagellin (archaellin)
MKKTIIFIVFLFSIVAVSGQLQIIQSNPPNEGVINLQEEATPEGGGSSGDNITSSILNNTYLKLDASNDPLTEGLQIFKSSWGSFESAFKSGGTSNYIDHYPEYAGLYNIIVATGSLPFTIGQGSCFLAFTGNIDVSTCGLITASIFSTAITNSGDIVSEGEVSANGFSGRSFYIEDDGDTEVYLYNNDSGGINWSIQSSGTNYGPNVGKFQIIDRTNIANALSILPVDGGNSSGFIGISDDTPSAKLDVNGNVSINTDLIVNEDASVGYNLNVGASTTTTTINAGYGNVGVWGEGLTFSMTESNRVGGTTVQYLDDGAVTSGSARGVLPTRTGWVQQIYCFSKLSSGSATFQNFTCEIYQKGNPTGASIPLTQYKTGNVHNFTQFGKGVYNFSVGDHTDSNAISCVRGEADQSISHEVKCGYVLHYYGE